MSASWKSSRMDSQKKRLDRKAGEGEGNNDEYYADDAFSVPESAKDRSESSR